ncbi:hypothetical protein [Roseovarius ramblicola]|uniref:Uncharacterized protein n=1 Tax=Roseovarius ramblicola TaxID=2022336 RepID=A0ABV5HYQ9_9RHOB
MNKNREKVKIAARRVESRLKAEGRHFEAEAVARIRRGYAAAQGTAIVLHRDNMDLRQMLGLPPFRKARGSPARASVQPIASAPNSPPPPKPER